MAIRTKVRRHFPTGPFRICDDTPVQARVDVLQSLAREGAQFGITKDLAAKAKVLACGRFVPHPGLLSVADALVIAQAGLEATQSLEYHENPVGEWFQPVDYTILHGGNCEGLSTVLVSLLGLLGMTGQIVWIPQCDEKSAPSCLNHVAVQVWVNGHWYWADPSIAGAMVGEHPNAALKRLAPQMRVSDLRFRARRPFNPGVAT